MYQRIMEILILLMDEFGGSDGSIQEINQVSDNLIGRGYTEQEISTAFTWLYNRSQHKDTHTARKIELSAPAENTFRVLHTLEQRYLSQPAFGFLLQLKHLNLIDYHEMEEVIDRLLVMGIQSATVDDVRMILQAVMFEDHGYWAGSLRTFGLKSDDGIYH